jgi:hypothetical protein
LLAARALKVESLNDLLDTAVKCLGCSSRLALLVGALPLELRANAPLTEEHIALGALLGVGRADELAQAARENIKCSIHGCISKNGISLRRKHYI